MKIEFEINFHGLPLIVEGDYQPAVKETHINPPEAASFELTKARLEKVPEADIDSLLCSCMFVSNGQIQHSGWIEAENIALERAQELDIVVKGFLS